MSRLGKKRHPAIEFFTMISGGSLLGYVVFQGSIEYAKWLVDDVKVPLDMKNKVGLTALDIARLRGHKAIADFLEEKMKT